MDYEPQTGKFVRKVNCANQKSGDVAGYTDKRGCVDICVDGRSYKAHRLAFLWMDGYMPDGYEIDHKDRNPSNNAWENLRVASHMCNLRNCKVKKSNTSGITGVYWHKKGQKWHARIMVYGRYDNLGLHETKTKAARARWDAEVRHNFPNCNTTSSAYLYLKKHGVL